MRTTRLSLVAAAGLVLGALLIPTPAHAQTAPPAGLDLIAPIVKPVCKTAALAVIVLPQASGQITGLPLPPLPTGELDPVFTATCGQVPTPATSVRCDTDQAIVDGLYKASKGQTAALPLDLGPLGAIGNELYVLASLLKNAGLPAAYFGVFDCTLSKPLAAAPGVPGTAGGSATDSAPSDPFLQAFVGGSPSSQGLFGDSSLPTQAGLTNSPSSGGLAVATPAAATTSDSGGWSLGRVLLLVAALAAVLMWVLGGRKSKDVPRLRAARS